MQSFLSPKQCQFYANNGYLVIDNFLSPEHCEQLRQECHRLTDSFDLEEHRTVFDAKNRDSGADQSYRSQQYFFDSWNRVSFFFEKDAFNEEGELTAPRNQCINKLGHYLHVQCPGFRQVTFDPRAQAISRDLGFQVPRICQSMYIFKQPRIGGCVDSHQDATFLWTEPTPPRLIGYWIPLEDTTKENGCLWFVPGSHRSGLVDGRRFRREAGPDGRDRMVFSGRDPNEIVPIEQYQPCEVKRGSLVLIDGFVLHMSHENRSQRSRDSYTWHVIDLPPGTRWSDENWIRPDSVESGFELLRKD